MKKTYIQPVMNVISIACQHLIAVSHIHSTSPSGDVNMDYDDEGGNPENAW